MKKYTKMVLAGVLLSSAVLGANTSVVKAASNPAINVNTSEIANNVIQVINELLNSDSTANKVNSQKNFSDLKDGDTMYVAPIFGKKDATVFNKTLQGELNVVDDNEQMVPMKAGTPDSTTGFVDKVSYTLDGTTKNVNVKYNYAKPTVSFNDNQNMNFKTGDTIDKAAINTDSVTVNTPNGADANGNKNQTGVKAELSNNIVTLTPSDSYISGIPAARKVNVYTEPNWTKLDNVTDTGTSTKTRTVTKLTDLDKPSVIANDNGQLYLVKASYPDNTADTATNVEVDYTATAIDSKGNVVYDDSTGQPITYTLDSANVKIDSDAIYPIVTYTDVNSKQTVFAHNFSNTDVVDGAVSESKIQSVLPKGYTLKTPADFKVTANDHTGNYVVSKNADTTINFKSINDDYSDSKVLKGNDGDRDILTAPEGYKLVNANDTIQILSADQTSKDVYVQKRADSENALSYTVTFRDKTDSSKPVGTEVKGTGSFGTYVGLTAPSGYAFASVLDNGFILLRNNQNVTKYVVAADTPYSISYVDQDTGKEVGT